jgi:hypothetical protein
MSEVAEQIHTLNQMEEPKGALGVFQLPCGHLNVETQELTTEVEVREITGYEEDMLSSKQVPPEQKLSRLISNCVIRMGTEVNRSRLQQMVSELVTGDRVFLLFAIRRVTLGDEMPVRETCPSCGVKSLFMIDLANDMKVKPMPDPRMRIFDVTLPSRKTARFRVSTGADEAGAAKLAKRQNDDALSRSLLMRLELLNGEKPTIAQVQALGMRDRHFLREQFQSVEGGVDTTLEFVCPACQNEWEGELDLKGTSFFFPGGRRRR